MFEHKFFDDHIYYIPYGQVSWCEDYTKDFGGPHDPGLRSLTLHVTNGTSIVIYNTALTPKAIENFLNGWNSYLDLT